MLRCCFPYYFFSKLYSFEFTNHLIPFHQEFALWFFQFLIHGFWIVWVEKNKKCMPFAVPASMLQKLFLMRVFYLIVFETLQEFCIPKSFLISLSSRLFPLQWLHRYKLSECVPS